MSQAQHRRIGQTDVTVSSLGFGAAPLGGFRGKIPDSVVGDTINYALEGGVTYFDTSPYYGYGRSEMRLGHYLREQPRDQYVLSTKVGRWLQPLNRSNPPVDLRPGGLPFQPEFDYSASGTARSLEQSMMRLGIPEIDIVYIHDVDVFTHGCAEKADQRYRETMEGCYPELERLRSAGVIKAIGVGLNETERSVRFAKDTDIDCILLAGRYTLLEQDSLEELMPLCTRNAISIVLGGPFNSGVLATGVVDGAKYDYGDVPAQVAKKVKALQVVCQNHSVNMIAAALQFPLAHRVVSSVIPGAMNKPEQDVNMKAMSERIPDDFWVELQEKNLLHLEAPVPKQE